jgi:hypothetical protein
MRVKKIVQSCTNRGEFNRVYKRYLDHKGLIHCDRCKYNKGENYKGRHYGGREDEIKYPNWKLTSKNPKQWMEKPIKIKTEKLRHFYRTIDSSGNIKEYKTYTTIKLK